jgi:Gas vesicle synthesis protein GvpL/GvpF
LTSSPLKDRGTRSARKIHPEAMANPAVVAENALYLYGVSRATKTKSRKLRNAGVDGVHVVGAVSCGEFLCWVSAVDPVAFGRELESNMENLEWLALHGVRHQQVVGEIAHEETIVPARFGTLFSSRRALIQDVGTRAKALQKVFARIADSDEWGVRVFAEPQPVRRASATFAKSGRDYLRKKAAGLKKRSARNEAALDEFAAALDLVASESAPAGKVSGAQPDLLWRATFLVARSRRKQWEQVLRKFVKQWNGTRRVEINGPWPPYSFVSDAK